MFGLEKSKVFQLKSTVLVVSPLENIDIVEEQIKEMSKLGISSVELNPNTNEYLKDIGVDQVSSCFCLCKRLFKQ